MTTPFQAGADVVTRSLSSALLSRLRQHVRVRFGEENWTDTPANTWRTLVASAQDALNSELMVHVIGGELRLILEEILGSEDILVQSSLYLRAARPQIGGQENVGWHRESFYGCPPQAFNVWVPVLNVTSDNAIRYIPGSAEIPSSEIITTTGDSDGVERGSSGHKIGQLYAPKVITGGVSLETAVPLPFADGEASIFSAELIHGAAHNTTDKIRFSVDFRVIAREHVGAQKQHFASGGKDMFEPLLF